MECRVQVQGESGRPLEYMILWLAPNRSRVDVHQGSTLVKTYSSSEAYGADPLLEPVLDFLTPGALSDAIYENGNRSDSVSEMGRRLRLLST